ncbi:MAG: PTS sugar transporter subunit IIA [Candidatus Omnitrophica bacterium]|nr:PTS sugar transporter subunit IIA [Candidatus Omnitrophota bacterium]
MIEVDSAATKLSSLLKENLIELELEGKDKSEIIGELVDIITKSGKAKNKKALTAAIMGRENLGSTAIGNGVAVPHAKIDGIKQTVLAFGRSVAGVDFNSLDGEKTHLFFMLISPKEDIGAHLKILAKISHLIKDRFMVGLFRKARSKKEVLSMISNLEKSSK